jgi:thiol:disulfide interchange protein DsbG
MNIFTPPRSSPRTAPCAQFQRRSVSLGLLSLLALGLSACSPQDNPAKSEATSVPVEQSYDLLAREGRGFTVGALMTANTVYVLFDPQCPHCGHLWQASLPLHKKVKFVWMPVAFIGAQSAPQGAALLTAINPVEAMSAHEASLLAGTGGTAASASIAQDVAQAIQKNTSLFNRLGGESVPFIVAKNQTTGAVVNYAGAMDTAALEQFLGLK